MKKTSLCFDCGEELNPFQEKTWEDEEGYTIGPLCAACITKRNNENKPPPITVGLKPASLQAERKELRKG